MTRLLAFILSRGVPEVKVESVQVVETPTSPQWALDLEVGELRLVTIEPKYTFFVKPDPRSYWRRFKEKYPHWDRIALKYGAAVSPLVCRLCPEFPSRDALVNWLSDTLDLSQGERNLLRLL
ncbi:hypothetical protein DRO59_06100 [Candidatus Bathyarchaeota archaeon]|nr:MAG: hypothetical protein DRO59_06100 [Candidatus Bathyarchaeota archaeon]